MGLVCLAEHMVLKRTVALKLILPQRLAEATTVSRFRKEAEALGRLEHPNVVQVRDYGVDERAGGLPYLVMEFLEGRTLRELLQEAGPLPLAEALPLLTEVAAALDYAHDHGILHRDVKPGNVMVVDTGDGPRQVKMLDLGLARFVAAAGDDPPTVPEPADGGLPATPQATDQHTRADGATAAGAVVGTPPYMAPELLQGHAASAASDLYAFGVLAFELVCGQRPLDNAAPQLRQAEIPAELEEILLRPLQAEPQARPRRAGAWLQDLRAAELGLRRRAWSRRQLPRRTGLAVTIAAAACAAAWGLGRTPALADLEARSLDLRLRLATPRPPDPRLLLVSIDDASLAADPTPLSELGDRVGRTLARALDLGAAGVGVDVLLPPQWGSQEGFVSLVIGHPQQVVLAARSEARQTVVGSEVADGLIAVALGGEATTELFGWVNMVVDRDGTVRRFATSFSGSDRVAHATFAARLAALLGRQSPTSPELRLIDYRVDRRHFARLSLADLQAAIEQRPDEFADRLIILGVEYVGAGDVFSRVPGPRGLEPEISGLTLQAVIVSTLLSGHPLGGGGGTLIMAISWLLSLAVVGMLLWQRPLVPALLVMAGAVLLLAAAAWGAMEFLDRATPLVAPVLGLLLAACLAMVARRRLAAPP
jgi:serine/threonine protein kinase